MKRFRYIRFTLAAAGMALLALGGCTSHAAKSGSAAEQDSVLQQTAFATDSIAFCEQKDSMLKCSVVVDYPSGDDSLSVGVRRYVAGELVRMYMPAMQEENGEAPVYKGSMADGKALVDFYGNMNNVYLKAQYAELKVLGMVEFTVPYADVKSCLTKEAVELALE